jgi:hypothetical protein
VYAYTVIASWELSQVAANIPMMARSPTTALLCKLRQTLPVDTYLGKYFS